MLLFIKLIEIKLKQYINKNFENLDTRKKKLKGLC